MTKKATPDLSGAKVDDILSMIKAPRKSEAIGKCTFVRKVDTLPENIQEAIYIACENRDVTSREILAFINLQTDVKVNMTCIQDHRNKNGCVVCLYGTAKS